MRTASVGVVGAATGLDVAPLLAKATRRVAPSDELHVAIIGVGSRGRSNMETFLRVPGVRVAALCDIYPPRFAQGRKITGEETPVYTDYRRMLGERARELDAVVVATPPHLHGEHVVAALESRLDVYGEKIMAFDLDACRAIVETVRRTGRRFQIGHQYRYAAWTREALRRVKDGEIGEVTHVFAHWHRNNNWR